MCGIFALLSRKYASKYSLPEIFKNLCAIQARGPDSTKAMGLSQSVFFGFHRLAIMDLSILGDQPMRLGDDLHLVCNGEIYNHAQLQEEFGFKTQSGSDCEVILHLYKHFGDIDEVAKRLDGVFAFTLYDAQKDVLYAGRDPIGVRPLFIGYDEDNDGIFFCSEAKGFIEFTKNVHQFPPGSTWSSDNADTFSKWWDLNNVTSFKDKGGDEMITDETVALKMIHTDIIEATEKRLMSDRKIGTFLSGGLDSSLITALVNQLNPYTINTYSVGMEGGTDFVYAAMVAEHLQTNHTEIVFTAQEGIDAVDEVIHALESYDITTIRASVGMYLMSKYISEKTDDIVIYSGEGADEVTQGYLYFHNAPDAVLGAIDSKRLVDNLHYYDVTRVDRTVARHGLEVRVPFLDKKFVSNFFKISPNLRTPQYKGIEKYLLRKAFEKDELLPKEVLWRTKEAMSDGVSSITESWHMLLAKYVDTIITDEEYQKACYFYNEIGHHNVPIHKEAYFYRKIYEKHFGTETDLIPYYWMPQWSDAKDPSARTISKYKQLIVDE